MTAGGGIDLFTLFLGVLRFELLTCLSMLIVSRSSCAVESADVLTVFTDKSRGDSLFRTALLGDGELAMTTAEVA